MHYDLIVIGLGPGGYESAAEAIALGLKVAVIERDLPGGTCLNRGCIPTKCLASAASQPGCSRPSYREAHASIAEVTAQLREGVAAAIKGADFYHGEASVAPDGSIAVEDKVLSADKVLIATGSSPALPAIIGADNCITSDDFLRLTDLPARIAIIGGGVIGLEIASIAAAFGSEVTVLEYCKEILPSFDTDIARRLRRALTARGINIIPEAAVREVSSDHTITYDRKGMSAVIESDLVMCAVGRCPVVPTGCTEAGIVLDSRGFIVTDSRFATTRQGFWAVGDVNGRCMLAHAASAQGRVALGLGEIKNPIPSVVFTEPQCASVGVSMDDMKSVKIPYSANGYALASDMEGLFKLDYMPDGRVAGCHVIGPHAADLVAAVSIAIAGRLTVRDLMDVVLAHPTLAEIIKQAAARAQ